MFFFQDLYDIKEFIQYVPGKGFAPFVSKVVQMRIDATVEGDDAKQLTAKLFANSGKTYHMDHII